ncbi:hypothetical protein [Terasakiella pusilla]|uniref:hypothetical protein n=1 Tax=Terasakiella pusilla TaxID=64973 RepID=UPI003AA81967
MDKIKVAKLSDVGRLDGDFKPLFDQLMEEFKRQHPQKYPSAFAISEISFKEKKPPSS